MSLLFIKICLYTVGILAMAACLKIIFNVLSPRWRKKEYLDQFKYFIQNDIYDGQTINRASLCYIPPKVQDTPPHQKNIKPKRSDLTKVLDIFLDHGTRAKYFLILADSGTGKTTFALNYYLHDKTQPKNRRHNIVLIPLRLQKAEQLILSSSDKRNSVLFLDGLDEDVIASQDPNKRLRHIFDLAKSYRKIIITCSINFFPKTRHMPTKKGYEIISPTDNNDPVYELKKAYLSSMTLTDAKRLLNANLPFGKARLGKQIIEYIKSNAAISITPFTLSYFNTIFSKTPDLTSRNDVYKAVIDDWVDQQKNWKDKTVLNQFLRYLAIDLFLERFKRGEEAIPFGELEGKAASWGISLHPFIQDEKSLINKNKSGTFKFSHRSIMEYLFVEQLISGEKSCHKAYLTPNMKNFLFDYFKKNSQSLNLSQEFLWLSRFRLKAQGINKTSLKENQANQKKIFHVLLARNNQYKFLARLNRFLKNPIFYEFGWETNLNENLKLALFQSESSLLYLNKRKWQVLINSKTIEITKRGQRIQKILFKEKDVMEYSKLENDQSLVKLNRSIGLSGLKMMNSINQAGYFAVLPELKNPNKLTIYFKSPS